MSTYSFSVSPSVATLLSGDPKTVDKLSRINDPGSGGDVSRALNMWDGLIHFFDPDTNTIPTGLLPRVQHRLEKRGHTVTVSYDFDVPKIPEVHYDYLCGIEMRDYQVEATNECLTKCRGLLWIATNGGKSAIISAVVGSVVRATGKTFIVIVPNKLLLHQTSKDIQTFLGPDVRVGMAGDGIRKLDCDILVGTYQTLLSGIPDGKGRCDREINTFLRHSIGILCDEAHHLAAIGIAGLFKYCKEAVFKLGCSGTVDKHDRALGRRADDKARAHLWTMESITGPVLYHVSNEFLIEEGHSARPRVVIVNDRAAYGPTVVTPPLNPMQFNSGMMAYKTVFERGVIQDRTFLKSICMLAATLAAQGKPPFVFSHSVDHLRALQATAKALRIPSELVSGKDKSSRRQEVIRRFTDEGNLTVFASSVFDEGFSVNGIRSLILAGARKSPVEILQRIGRGLRKKDEDNTTTVFDFDPLHSTLLHKQFKSRKATYEQEGFDIEYITDFSLISQMTF
jgi:superfamily II DNA or RNA helicase